MAGPYLWQRGAVPSGPSPALLALELPRAAGEYGLLAAAVPLLARSPRGDGHSVLVLPGFTADDVSTRPLRRYLRGLGYEVHGWKLGRNVGPTPRILDGLATRVRDVHGRTGEHISIVGWSLGGIYAREIARRTPESVRQVITLGSPFGMVAESRRPITVPTTSIFSRSDGIAPWHHCREDDGEHRQSIEVVGSHCGLGHHPAVLHVIADRLAQPRGSWAPFRARGVWRPFFP
jgi:dienelactone hydrolase